MPSPRPLNSSGPGLWSEPPTYCPLSPAVSSLLRLTWLLCLFAPVALTAPLVGDFLGISRARWLRLLRCGMLAGGLSGGLQA